MRPLAGTRAHKCHTNRWPELLAKALADSRSWGDQACVVIFKGEGVSPFHTLGNLLAVGGAFGAEEVNRLRSLVGL